MTDFHFYLLALAALAIIALQVLALLRGRAGNGDAFDRLEHALRREMQLGAQTARQDTAASLAQYWAATSRRAA
jgi:hypothetical protein